jgi:hypothetical protein
MFRGKKDGRKDAVRKTEGQSKARRVDISQEQMFRK